MDGERFYLLMTISCKDHIYPTLLTTIKATEKLKHSLVFVVPPEYLGTFVIENADQASKKFKLYVAPFPQIPKQQALLDQDGYMERLLTYIVENAKADECHIESCLRLRHVDREWIPTYARFSQGVNRAISPPNSSWINEYPINFCLPCLVEPLKSEFRKLNFTTNFFLFLKWWKSVS